MTDLYGHELCFPTPPSEPGVRLSSHPALRLSVGLSFLLMARYAKCPKVPFDICIDWPFEPPHGANMIHFRRGVYDNDSTELAAIFVSFQDKGP